MYKDVTADAPAFPFYFRQVRAGPHENFHYVIGNPTTKEAAVIDPTYELERLFASVRDDGYTIRHALFTHGHADHIGGAADVVRRGVQRVYLHETGRLHDAVGAALDLGAEVGLAVDGDVIALGDLRIEWLHTPGHQPEASCFIVSMQTGARVLLSGDTLFIDTCGRTDFPGGNTDHMFASMQRLKVFSAPDLYVMPGHDYSTRTTESLADQIQNNPALAADREAFGGLACLTS